MPFGAWGFESPLAHYTQYFCSDSASLNVSAAGPSCPLPSIAPPGQAEGDDDGHDARQPARDNPDVRQAHDFEGDVAEVDHNSDVATVAVNDGRTSPAMTLDTSHMPLRAREALSARATAAKAAERIRERGQPRSAATRTDQGAAPPTRRGGLRAVADSTERLASPVPRQPALDAQPVVATPRLDPQHRLVAKPLLTALGWEVDTALTAFVEASAGGVWVQRREVPAPSGCACQRCRDEARQVLALPGAQQPSSERVAIDAHGRLVLSDGLRHAAGVPRRGQVAAVALPAWHALLVRPAAALATALIPGGLPDALAAASPVAEHTTTREELA